MLIKDMLFCCMTLFHCHKQLVKVVMRPVGKVVQETVGLLKPYEDATLCYNSFPRENPAISSAKAAIPELFAYCSMVLLITPTLFTPIGSDFRFAVSVKLFTLTS